MIMALDALQAAFLRAAPVDTRAKYEKALKLHKRLRYSRKGSPEFKYAMALGALIEKYEEENYPLEAVDPIEVIAYRMEELGWDRSQLAQYVGSMSMASKLLNRRRKLTMAMARALAEALDVPLDMLTVEYVIEPYESERARA